MRTRFIRSTEIESLQLQAVMASDVDLFACGIGAPRAAVVDKLLSATSADTVITRSESGKTFRQIRSAWSDEWDQPDAPAPRKMPCQDMLVGGLLGAINEHQVEPLLHSGAGQGIGYHQEVKPVAELMYGLVEEATKALKRHR